jgi:hypothetical protein
VVGNPGRLVGWACTCGRRLPGALCCACGRAYVEQQGQLHELGG